MACVRLVKLLQEKISATSDRDEVVQCLTIVPDTWSISKTAEVFNVTQYALRQARELKAKKGILATPEKQSREGISEETKNSVIRFYENEEVSRLCSRYEGLRFN